MPIHIDFVDHKKLFLNGAYYIVDPTFASLAIVGNVVMVIFILFAVNCCRYKCLLQIKQQRLAPPPLPLRIGKLRFVETGKILADKTREK